MSDTHSSADTDTQIWLADDGSVHSTWVSHYAYRFARNSPSRRLRVLHVVGQLPAAPDWAAQRLKLGERYGVQVVVTQLARNGSVAQTLADAVAGPNSVLVAGLRSHQSQKGVVAGTVTEQLLRTKGPAVLAMRVV